ncbi:MAG TPA: BREX system Lon protease-like protein BrxL [Oscillospiraceae bacterium]|nr:BREX system Lon protease-like protein BrxL [Oscillospiraceae bacterium]
MDKLRDCFDEMVVYKDLKQNSTFKALKLPSFLRDWVLKKFEDEDGHFDVDELSSFVDAYMPKKEEWLKIKNRIIVENERVKILTKISIDIDIKTEEITFSLPDFGLSNKETVIEPHIWDTFKKELVKGHETWGIVELGYRQPDDSAKPKIPGKIMLTGFTDFCPYSIDMDFYKDVRSEFTTDEWINILLGAMDYNAEGYASEEQKLAMLTRLLPFVEKNLNLIELAPKGTGKSYVYGNISKYGLLTDGGKVSRAKMFYDTARKTLGYITGHDYVAIDEVKLVQFSDVNEMRSILQGYMEKGRCDVNGFQVSSDAGIVFLGNIETDNMDEYRNMLTELPSLFQESAMVDRIHGFIKGWEIPPMQPGLKVSGWALNTEYFCTILHALRDDITYRAIVEQLVEVSDNGYERHIEAVKRIATAYLKLLFPNVRSVKDINAKKFQQYCLRPAVRMRGIIQKQLAILDKEYTKDEKQMPTFYLREISDED